VAAVGVVNKDKEMLNQEQQTEVVVAAVLTLN
jgi:hypothetical protein